jgi:hypothetical protein
MATRTIVTSQPDVACDVCERRLLRGEHHDVFLAAGRRRTVCELCVPRAVHEGWLRESETSSLSLPPQRPRRGRSFFVRLRQARRAAAEDRERAGVEEPAGERPSYDFLEGYGGAETETAEPHAAEPHAAARPARVRVLPRESPFDREGPSGGRGVVPQEADEQARTETVDALELEREGELALALEAFNAGEHPRRVAGVARSLGAPTVSVWPAEHARNVVRIVVAWELCWYRYEVDLDESPPEARVIAQGTELEELAAQERTVNAAAAASGSLHLAAP